MVEALQSRLTEWAPTMSGMVAVALVGSHARGEARPDSDVDLVLLTTKPQDLLSELAWTTGFGPVEQTELEDWGRVTSVRVWYKSGLEVEFSVTAPEWATQPDEGTRRVVAAGLKVVWDPHDTLTSLL